jgi:hypothetical protein
MTPELRPEPEPGNRIRSRQKNEEYSHVLINLASNPKKKNQENFKKAKTQKGIRQWNKKSVILRMCEKAVPGC